MDSFLDRIRPYLQRAQRYLEQAGVYLERAWAWLRQASARAWEQTSRVSRRWYAVATAAIAGWIAALEARRANRAQRQRQANREGRNNPERQRRRRGGALSPDAAIVVARPEDDIATITGRLDTAEDLEVALVVPRSARRLREPSVWPHVAAHARRRGAVVSVVSPRRDVRQHARANGLRAAGRLRHLQRDGFRIPLGAYTLRIPPVPYGGLVKLGAVAAIVAAVFWVASYQIPSATVTVVPNADEYTTTREVRLSPIVDRSDIETNVVLAGSARETITTLITAETTGETEVGDDAAQVSLVFSSEAPEEVELASGTTVTDEDGLVSFSTQDDVTLEPGDSVEVAAVATEAGTLGNIDAGTLTVGNGLPDGVSVTNPSSASGGTSQTVRAVHEDDMERARSIADDVLREISERSLEELLGEETVVFPDTLSTAIFSETPLQQLEEPAEVLLVEYVIVVSAIVLDPDTVTDFGAEMIRADLPPGVGLLPGTTTVTTHDDAEADAGQIHVTLEATGLVAEMAQFAELPGEITGMRPAEAEALIAERVALMGPPHIEISPTIVPWRWLPRSEDRIEIELAGPGFFEPDEEEDDDAPPEDEVPEGEEPLPDPDELDPLDLPDLEEPGDEPAEEPAA